MKKSNVESGAGKALCPLMWLLSVIVSPSWLFTTRHYRGGYDRLWRDRETR